MEKTASDKFDRHPSQIPGVSLVVSDLDGTLIRGDTVCETIARHLGHLERMREFELLRDQDQIAASRIELARYYHGRPQTELEGYLRSCRLAPGTAEGFKLLREYGVRTAIVSITWKFAVAWFTRLLGANHYVGTGLSEDGHVAHFWPKDKATYVTALMSELGLSRNEVAAIGDSWGDLEMLRSVGHPYYVGDQLPAGEAFIHLPGGDIHEIAQRVIRGGTAAR